MRSNHGFLVQPFHRPEFIAATKNTDRSALPMGHSDHRYVEQSRGEQFKLDEQDFHIWRAFEA